MPPKKTNTTGCKSRKDAQKKVAFERAAHFARADQPPNKRLRSAASTTPTGVISSSISHDRSETKDDLYWPGPFSTANDMINKVSSSRFEGC
jgi:hypothetical protein